MGRLASSLDWMEESGSHSGLRAAPIAPCESNEFPRLSDEEAALLEEPTQPFVRAQAHGAMGDVERITARDVRRLAVLVDWIADEDPSSPVVPLVRSLLSDFDDVSRAIGALLAVSRAWTGPPPTPQPVCEALARAIGLWRASLVEYVDDLALADPWSLSGWASLPPYSTTYFLAVVRPALHGLEEWAATGRSDVIENILRDVGGTIARLDRTVQSAVERDGAAAAGETGPARSMAW